MKKVFFVNSILFMTTNARSTPILIDHDGFFFETNRVENKEIIDLEKCYCKDTRDDPVMYVCSKIFGSENEALGAECVESTGHGPLNYDPKNCMKLKPDHILKTNVFKSLPRNIESLKNSIDDISPKRDQPPYKTCFISYRNDNNELTTKYYQSDYRPDYLYDVGTIDHEYLLFGEVMIEKLYCGIDPENQTKKAKDSILSRAKVGSIVYAKENFGKILKSTKLTIVKFNDHEVYRGYDGHVHDFSCKDDKGTSYNILEKDFDKLTYADSQEELEKKIPEHEEQTPKDKADSASKMMYFAYLMFFVIIVAGIYLAITNNTTDQDFGNSPEGYMVESSFNDAENPQL